MGSSRVTELRTVWFTSYCVPLVQKTTLAQQDGMLNYHNAIHLHLKMKQTLSNYNLFSQVKKKVCFPLIPSVAQDFSENTHSFFFFIYISPV